MFHYLVSDGLIFLCMVEEGDKVCQSITRSYIHVRLLLPSHAHWTGSQTKTKPYITPTHSTIEPPPPPASSTPHPPTTTTTTQRRLPFLFLEDVQRRFTAAYPPHQSQGAIAFAMNEAFAPTLQATMVGGLDWLGPTV